MYIFCIKTLTRRRINAQARFVAGVLRDNINASDILEPFNVSTPRPATTDASAIQWLDTHNTNNTKDPITAMLRTFNKLYQHLDFRPSTSTENAYALFNKMLI